MQERWARQTIHNTNSRGQQLLKAYPNELGRVGEMLKVDEPPSYNEFRRSRQSQKPQAGGAPAPKQAPDGNWYVPDPQRPGKYLQVR